MLKVLPLLTFLLNQATSNNISKELPKGRFQGIKIEVSGGDAGAVTVADIINKISVKVEGVLRMNGVDFATLYDRARSVYGRCPTIDGTTFKYVIFIPLQMEIIGRKASTFEMTGNFAASVSNLISVSLVKAADNAFIQQNYINLDSENHTGSKTRDYSNLRSILVTPVTGAEMDDIKAIDVDTGEELCSGSFADNVEATEIFSDAQNSPAGALIEFDRPRNVKLTIVNSSTGTAYSLLTEGLI